MRPELLLLSLLIIITNIIVNNIIISIINYIINIIIIIIISSSSSIFVTGIPHPSPVRGFWGFGCWGSGDAGVWCHEPCCRNTIDPRTRMTKQGRTLGELLRLDTLQEVVAEVV